MPPKALSELGNIRNCVISRAILGNRTLEGRLPPIHPLNPLPSWAQPKAFTNLGNNIHDDISRESFGRRTLGGEGGLETRGLRLSCEVVLMREIGFLGGFMLAERTIRYDY